MPARDNTGPNGMGSMTGRGLGNCSGNATSFSNRFGGRGAGNGNGNGRKFRGGGFGNNARFSMQDFSGVSEKTILENEINVLKEQLKSLENMLSETKGKKEE